jgi:transposase-like protein
MNSKTKMDALKPHLLSHLEAFNGDLRCPHPSCRGIDIQHGNGRNKHRCRSCNRKFDARTGSIFENRKGNPYPWYACANRVMDENASTANNQSTLDNEWSRANGFIPKTAASILAKIREVRNEQSALFSYMSEEYKKLESLTEDEALDPAVLANLLATTTPMVSPRDKTTLLFETFGIIFYVTKDNAMLVDWLSLVFYFTLKEEGINEERGLKTILASIPVHDLEMVLVREGSTQSWAVDPKVIGKACFAYMQKYGSSQDVNQLKLVAKCRKLNLFNLEIKVTASILDDSAIVGKEIRSSMMGSAECILEVKAFYAYLNREFARLNGSEFNTKKEETFGEFFQRCICAPLKKKLQKIDGMPMSALRNFGGLSREQKKVAKPVIHDHVDGVIGNLMKSQTMDEFNGWFDYVTNGLLFPYTFQ